MANNYAEVEGILMENIFKTDIFTSIQRKHNKTFQSQKEMEYKFKSDLYETALINYNILVDLSWTITYGY